MKSIMEEASSVFKAIENAWKRAGQPQSFSVKIFEEAQKNFFGLTTKPAKVGIFFEENSQESSQQSTKNSPTVTTSRQKPRVEKKSYGTVAPQPAKVHPTLSPSSTYQKSSAVAEGTAISKTEWTDEMVKFAQEWMKSTLSLMEFSQVPFTTVVSKYHLRFNFDSSITQDENKEKLLFRSLAHLVMASLRTHLKKELRGLKVILHS